MRIFSFLIFFLLLTSCDKFSFTKEASHPILDTIVDVTSVDTSPSFKECDSIIDKTKKSDCFRKTIHEKIGAELQKHQFKVQDAIDETVYVDLVINAKGKIIFKQFKSSAIIKEQLPELDSVIQLSVNNIPIITAANKRGIPVTTKYQLPIRIVLKE